MQPLSAGRLRLGRSLLEASLEWFSTGGLLHQRNRNNSCPVQTTKATHVCCPYTQWLCKAWLLNDFVDTWGIFSCCRFVFSEVQFSFSLWSLAMISELGFGSWKAEWAKWFHSSFRRMLFFFPVSFPKSSFLLSSSLALSCLCSLCKFSKSFLLRCWITKFEHTGLKA